MEERKAKNALIFSDTKELFTTDQALIQVIKKIPSGANFYSGKWYCKNNINKHRKKAQVIVSKKRHLKLQCLMRVSEKKFVFWISPQKPILKEALPKVHLPKRNQFAARQPFILALTRKKCGICFMDHTGIWKILYTITIVYTFLMFVFLKATSIFWKESKKNIVGVQI